MAYVDLTESGFNPGVDKWRVDYATEERSKKSGDLMFAVKLVRVSNPSDQVREFIMLEGNGRHVGRRQLSAIIGATAKGEIPAGQLIGAEVWVDTCVEETPQYGPQLKVNRKGTLRCAGFQHIDERPDGVAAPTQEDSGEIPF